MRNPEAVAWTIATEGTIAVRRSYNSVHPIVIVFNTDAILLEKFRDMVGMGRTSKLYQRGNNHKPSGYWALTSRRDCLLFCSDIVEYLPAKQEQAKLMIEFCAIGILRCESNGKALISEREYEIYGKMKSLNRKGQEKITIETRHRSESQLAPIMEDS